MKQALLIITLTLHILCMGQTNREVNDSTNNPIASKLELVKVGLLSQGVDTILTYLNWSFTDRLTYYGEGCVIWKRNNNYHMQTLYYDDQSDSILVQYDSAFSGDLIDRFFRDSIQESVQDVLIETSGGSGKNHNTISFQYGKIVFNLSAEDNLLYSSNNMGIVWMKWIKDVCAETMPYHQK